MKEWSVLQCQAVTGYFEEVVVSRVKKMGEMARTAQRCHENEDLMGHKLN